MKFRAKVELFTFPQYHKEGELAIMATLKDFMMMNRGSAENLLKLNRIQNKQMERVIK